MNEKVRSDLAEDAEELAPETQENISNNKGDDEDE